MVIQQLRGPNFTQFLSTWTKHGQKASQPTFFLIRSELMVLFNYEFFRKSSAQWYEIAGFFFQMLSLWTFKGPPPTPWVDKRGLFADPLPSFCPRSC